MSKKTYLKQLKSELKTLSSEIRQKKSLRKKPLNEFGNGYVPGLAGAQFDARHTHLAYCMLRGRTYEQIEPTVRENNKANLDYVQALIDKCPIDLEVESLQQCGG